jgi:hypothetical protein
MLKKSVLLVVFFCIILESIVYASPQLIKNLDTETLILNENGKTYIPFLPQYHRAEVVYLSLSAEQLNQGDIYLSTENTVAIFLNGKFYSYQKNKINCLKGKDLIKFASASTIFLAIKSIDNLPLTTFKIALYKSTNTTQSFLGQSKVILRASFEEIRKKIMANKNRYVLGVIGSLLVFIFTKTFYPFLFTNLFRFDKQPIKDRVVQRKNFVNSETLIIIFLTALLVGFYFYVFSDKVIIFRRLVFLEGFHGFAVFLLGFFATILLFLFKITINLAAAVVFDTSSFAKILVNEFAKTVLQILVVLYPIYFLVLSPYYKNNLVEEIHFIFPVSFLVIVFIFKEIYFFYQLFNFNKNNFIAYICVCDLFPTMVLIKILTQLEFTQ